MKYYPQLLILIILLAMFMFTTYSIVDSYRFVSSKYSKYCYNSRDVNKNIKDRLYYKTLEECNKPLK
jgi:hypothetical protein